MDVCLALSLAALIENFTVIDIQKLASKVYVNMFLFRFGVLQLYILKLFLLRLKLQIQLCKF